VVVLTLFLSCPGLEDVVLTLPPPKLRLVLR
jgi:hypothetical protein